MNSNLSAVSKAVAEGETIITCAPSLCRDEIPGALILAWIGGTAQPGKDARGIRRAVAKIPELAAVLADCDTALRKSWSALLRLALDPAYYEEVCVVTKSALHAVHVPHLVPEVYQV